MAIEQTGLGVDVEIRTLALGDLTGVFVERAGALELPIGGPLYGVPVIFQELSSGSALGGGGPMSGRTSVLRRLDEFELHHDGACMDARLKAGKLNVESEHLRGRKCSVLLDRDSIGHAS